MNKLLTALITLAFALVTTGAQAASHAGAAPAKPAASAAKDDKKKAEMKKDGAKKDKKKKEEAKKYAHRLERWTGAGCGRAPVSFSRPPMRTSRGPKLAALYLLAALLGAGSAWAVLRYATGSGEGTGPWRVSLLAGSADADAYTRARVAMTGLLALSRSETMYYVAMHDSAGGALRTRCRYRVSGRPPAARWWSITAYADDFFLIANPQRRYSVNGFSAVVDASGSFTLITEPNPSAAAGANVIPTPADRGLILALRLYNPAPGLAAAPASLDAPRIERLGPCR